MGIRKVGVFFQRFLETVRRLLGTMEFIQGIAQIKISHGMIRVTGNSKPVTALGINEQLLQVVDIAHIDVSVPEVRIELHRLLIGLKSEWVGFFAGVIPQSFLEPTFRRFFLLEVFDPMFHFFGEVV